MLCVVWDWNGTLLDDVDCCLGVMNRMLSRRGLPSIGGVAAYREIFTFPVRDYYVLAGLDLAKESFDDLADEYMRDYRQSSKTCGLMKGAASVLDALRDMGAVQVLASASRQDDLERQLAEQGLTGKFEAVLGVSDQLGGGKSGVAQAYLTAHGFVPEDALFVGDSIHDWEVANAMGCRCVLIANGHQSSERLRSTGADVLEDISLLPEYCVKMSDLHMGGKRHENNS